MGGGVRVQGVYYRASKLIMDMHGVRVPFPNMTFKLSSPLKNFAEIFKHLEPNAIEHRFPHFATPPQNIM